LVHVALQIADSDPDQDDAHSRRGHVLQRLPEKAAGVVAVRVHDDHDGLEVGAPLELALGLLEGISDAVACLTVGYHGSDVGGDFIEADARAKGESREGASGLVSVVQERHPRTLEAAQQRQLELVQQTHEELLDVRVPVTERVARVLADHRHVV